MSNDDVFRIILIAGFLIFMPIGICHRLKSRTDEKLDRRQEGIFILVTLRALGIAGLYGLIAYMIDPSRMAWSSVPLPNWFLFLAGVFFSVLIVIRTRKEDENLLGRFGDEYRKYMQQTGRFLPRV